MKLDKNAKKVLTDVALDFATEALLKKTNKSASKAIDPEVIEDKYDDADKFENDMNNDFKDVAGKLSRGDILKALEKLSNIAGEVMKFESAQKTKRRKIDAECAIAVKKIDAQTKVIMSYLERSFDERKNNFKELFAVLDKSVAEGKIEAVAGILDAITKLAASSPFKELANIETVGAKLKDKNHAWDV